MSKQKMSFFTEATLQAEELISRRRMKPKGLDFE